MTFQVFWILFSAGCHHTNFPKINYPIISRTFDHMTISKDKLFIQLMSLSYRHIKVWLRQTRSNKYTGKNIWGHSSLRIHWGRLNNRLCLTSISLLRFNFILIDFPISKIFCTHQINNRERFYFFLSHHYIINHKTWSSCPFWAIYLERTSSLIWRYGSVKRLLFLNRRKRSSSFN